MKTLCTFLLLSVLVSLSSATEIRVRNATGTSLKNVVIGGKKYGDIKDGASTDYQHWDGAYRYSSVSLLSDSKPLAIQPIDYVGETLLGEGKFTYVLSFKYGGLDIAAEKDADAK